MLTGMQDIGQRWQTMVHEQQIGQSVRVEERCQDRFHGPLGRPKIGVFL